MGDQSNRSSCRGKRVNRGRNNSLLSDAGQHKSASGISSRDEVDAAKKNNFEE